MPTKLPIWLLILSTLTIATSASAHNLIRGAVPFACTGEAFIIRGSPAQLTQIDQTTSPCTFVAIGGPAGFEINALGFRRSDGLLYALQNTGTIQIVQIDSAGDVFPLGLPAGLPATARNAGDVSVDGGTMFLQSTDESTLYRVPLPALTPVSSVPVTGGTGTLGDWAVNPIDGLLYGGTSNNDVSVLDPTTGIRTDLAVDGLTGGGFGSAWFNAAGTLFLYNAGSGTIFEIDLSGPMIISTHSSPISGLNDSAACVQDLVGAAKDMTSTNTGLPATFTLDYSFESFSATEDLFALSALDDLTAVFGTHVVDWTFTSITSSPFAFANPAFDGHSSTELINQAPAQDLLSGTSATITVTIEVLTLNNVDTNGDFCNQILVTGANAGGATFGDLSTDGVDPDPDGDSSPDERAPSCVNEMEVPVTLMQFAIE